MPARNPYTDEAIEARYHTSVIALVALEREHVTGRAPRGPGGDPVSRAFSGRDASELTSDRLAATS